MTSKSEYELIVNSGLDNGRFSTGGHRQGSRLVSLIVLSLCFAVMNAAKRSSVSASFFLARGKNAARARSARSHFYVIALLDPDQRNGQ